jgi:hypothetical protein
MHVGFTHFQQHGVHAVLARQRGRVVQQHAPQPLVLMQGSHADIEQVGFIHGQHHQEIAQQFAVGVTQVCAW